MRLWKGKKLYKATEENVCVLASISFKGWESAPEIVPFNLKLNTNVKGWETLIR